MVNFYLKEFNNLLIKIIKIFIILLNFLYNYHKIWGHDPLISVFGENLEGGHDPLQINKF